MSDEERCSVKPACDRPDGHAGKHRQKLSSVVFDEQRRSIAWCGNCGNVSVDGINFGRVNDGLECAACGARSPHFEYIRASSLGPQLTAGEAKAAMLGLEEIWKDFLPHTLESSSLDDAENAYRKLSLIADEEKL